MKIAFVSDNGTTISRHFGRARHYLVVTLHEGREIAREQRTKHACHGHDHSSPDVAHDDHDHHEDMLAMITDCDVLIAGGMGSGMDQRLRTAGVRTIRTQVAEIDQALRAFLAGTLSDTLELVH